MEHVRGLLSRDKRGLTMAGPNLLVRSGLEELGDTEFENWKQMYI